MELEHVQITKEMEEKILDEIDQRLADLEDIDVDAKILVRHMDKHSDFKGYESNVNTLTSIEENVLEAYKVELDLMKRRIIASNHDLRVNEMKDMNLLLDNAEVTINNTRSMIDSFIDVHVESEEHQHEHDHEDDHDHDDHDSFEDYSDLLSNETEASEEEQILIVNTIEKGLKDLDEVRNHRSQMEEHLQDHRDSKDHVNTKFAESVLEEIKTNDVEDYKQRLLELRKQVEDGISKGHVKIDFVDKIVSTLERANIFVEVSKSRLHIADQLDDEASNDHKDENHADTSASSQLDTTSDDEDYVDDEREAGPAGSLASYEEGDLDETELNNIAEVKVEQQIENISDGVNEDVSGDAVTDNEPANFEDVEEDEVSMISIFVDSNYYLILGCLVLFLLLVAVAAMKFRSYQEYHSGSESMTKSDKFHEIGGICSPQDDRSLHNYNFRTFDSPKLTSAEEFVKSKKETKKEDWNSRQWNQDCYKEPYKRK